MKSILLPVTLAVAIQSQAPLRGQEPPPLAPAATVPVEAEEGGGTVLGYEHADDRMTVPVNIDGRGPYQFVVDTGAERTVIAQELANTLDLGQGRRTRMHSMSEVSDIRTVLIPALEVGGKTVQDIHAPALARRFLGAEGMLGVDSLKAQRVSFDFVRRQMTITPSKRRQEKWEEEGITVTARTRFGHLVLVDASVDGQKVWVILDTGSQVTIGNSALRRKLEKKQRIGATVPVELLSVTGGRVVADQAVAQKVRLGGMDILRMPIAFADVHPFRKLALTDRPALLLGMDALRLFDRVSVDFANRRVRMLSPARSEAKTGTRMAAVPPLARAS